MFDRIKKRIIHAKLTKSKTVWVGVAILIYGLVLAMNGNTEEGLKTVSEALALIFLRQGIEKINKK